MTTVAFILTLIVALIHVYIVVLEMVLWRRRGAGPPSASPPSSPHRPRSSRATRVCTTASSSQGSSSARRPVDHRFAFAVLAVVVIVAGLYGAATVSRRILLVQAVPGALALAAQLLAH